MKKHKNLNGKCYTYISTDVRKEKEKLREKYRYIQYGEYEPEIKIDDFEKDNEFIETVLDSKQDNRKKTKNMIEPICHKMCEQFPYNKKNYLTKDEQDEAERQIMEQKIHYLNGIFYVTDKDDIPICDILHTTEITNFLIGLFEKSDKNGIQVIDALDNMSFAVKVNQGKTIKKYSNPITWIATQVGLPDSDHKEADREYNQRKKGRPTMSFDISNEEIISSSSTVPISNANEGKYKDEQLNNYIYLNDELKQIFNWLWQGYSKKDIRARLGLTESKLNTKIKHIRKQLENPTVKADKRMKSCCVCNQEKIITEFTKDKSRKDGYSPRCKQCDKERKNKNKIVGNIKKTA